MNLDESQKQQVGKWLSEGLKLSDIQNKLASEFGLRLTYMEMRFLLDDLRLQPKDAPKPTASPILQQATPTKEPAPETLPQEEPTAPGRVSVTVDQLTRPGAVVSGKVKFSDGKSAEWYLDQMGRLGVAPAEKGYKPSQADVAEFQVALQNELARFGF